jgi:O-acetyl-ADP-ribose deacetylase
MDLAFSGGKRLRALAGDITRIAADAIVNAANSALRGGGGVDGAIHRAGGPAIMRELDGIREAQGSCPTGKAVATTAGDLPAKYVFHAVGPVFRGGAQGEAEQLRSCYATCLAMAEERQVATITFPAISTGVYGYPLEPAAEIAIEAAVRHLLSAGTTVREITFVLFSDEAYEVYSRRMRQIHGKSGPDNLE